MDTDWPLPRRERVTQGFGACDERQHGVQRQRESGQHGRPHARRKVEDLGSWCDLDDLGVALSQLTLLRSTEHHISRTAESCVG